MKKYHMKMDMMQAVTDTLAKECAGDYFITGDRKLLKNKWLLSNLNCIDFNNEIGVMIKDSYHFKDGCDSGDHLHPSKHAYELMGKLACKKIYL